MSGKLSFIVKFHKKPVRHLTVYLVLLLLTVTMSAFILWFYSTHLGPKQLKCLSCFYETEFCLNILVLYYPSWCTLLSEKLKPLLKKWWALPLGKRDKLTHMSYKLISMMLDYTTMQYIPTSSVRVLWSFCSHCHHQHYSV